MPELPDLEHFKSYLENKALNQEIIEVKSFTKSLIKKISFKDFKKIVKGNKLAKAERRGKYLIVFLSNSKKKLVFHFGMTGNFAYTLKGETPNYSQVIFKFKEYQLNWINKRKLGKVFLVDEINQIKALAEMGPEPLLINQQEFIDLLEKNQQRKIKAFFLDQTAIAGIGNEYSDEILFRSKINPKRKINQLNKQERIRLFKEMQKVLKEAIKLGVPEKQPGDKWLHFHRNDLKCPKNPNHKLKKETIAGRSSVYCPIHQS